MTRIRLSIPSLPVLLVLGALLAITAFGVTRSLIAPDASALPPLDIAADTAAAAPGALDASKLYALRINTTVSIESAIGSTPMIGAGVAIDQYGTIVTASHVVQVYGQEIQRASAIYVTFAGGDEVEAKLIAVDQHNDLAILRVDPSAVTNYVYAPLAMNSDKVVVGSEVAIIGSPYGNDESISKGIVSSTHRIIDSRINAAWRIPDAIQFDAATNQGNSGGPLFNARGEVIGIVQSINSESKSNAGVNFAVSSSIVARALALSKGHTEIPYAWLGIDTITLSPQLAGAHGLGVAHGALVQSVDGPAARAGLSAGSQQVQHMGRSVRLGDVIVKIGGQPVTSADDLQRLTGRLDPAQPVTIVVQRAGEQRSLNVIPAVSNFMAIS